MYNKNVYCHYILFYVMTNKYCYYTSSCIMKIHFHVYRNICCHYIIANKYCYYTSSHITRYTLSCITEIFVVIKHHLI